MMGQDLIRLLGEIDEELLMREDKAYCGAARRTQVCRWSALAACLVVFICVFSIIFGPSGDFTDNNDLGGSGSNPGTEDGEYGEKIVIDSLDKLNYYAGKRVLSIKTVNCKFGAETGMYFDPIDPTSVFTVNKVISFKIDLTTPSNINGFLEAKFGGGEIDVVITENSLENMITFCDGDNYFSCLYNGYSRYQAENGEYILVYEYSTHKYIEGFNIVKNLDTYNYRFLIYVNENTGKVGKFECRFSVGGTGSPVYYPDTARVVSGSSEISTLRGEYTIAELESYFNRKNEKEG